MKTKSTPKFKPGKTKSLPAEISAKSSNYELCGRFWIACNQETFLGFGRVVLLERIKEYGSITKAAASMKMAYRHAWQLVDSMNRLSPKPLVISSVGGKGGGGAQLTQEGETAVKNFWLLHDQFKKLLANLSNQFALKKEQTPLQPNFEKGEESE